MQTLLRGDSPSMLDLAFLEQTLENWLSVKFSFDLLKNPHSELGGHDCSRHIVDMRNKTISAIKF